MLSEPGYQKMSDNKAVTKISKLRSVYAEDKITSTELLENVNLHKQALFYAKKMQQEGAKHRFSKDSREMVN